jgi:predicted Zn-dependent protease
MDAIDARRRSCFLALLALPLAIAVACETVPVTGRSQLNLLSEAEESKLGAEAFTQIVAKSKVSTEAGRNQMVQRVASRNTAVAGGQRQWETKLIDDPNQANAFALPGGKIGVYTGILPITRDEAGLAAVMGHEVAHVTARHSGERMSQQIAAQAGLGVIGSILGASPQTTESLGGIVASGLLLPFGRRQESEADHIGLIYMAKAGYDPRAARDLWVRMAEASRGRSRPPEFLSTHPSEETRIKQIEGWLPEALQHYKPR